MNRRVTSNFSSPADMLRMLISDIETNFGGQIGSYSFPPHNVIRVADDHVQIQIAVAGFAKEDISIEQVDDMLVVTGTKKDSGVTYLYRGLASRSFELKWKIPADMVIGKTELIDGKLVHKAAKMEQGMLTIDLIKVENNDRIKKIQID